MVNCCTVFGKEWKLGIFAYQELFSLYGIHWYDSITQPTKPFSFLGNLKVHTIGRLIFCLTLFGLNIWSIFVDTFRYPYYLTNWAAISCSVYATITTWLDIRYACNSSYDKAAIPFMVKLQMAIRGAAVSTNFVVFLLYWGVLYNWSYPLGARDILIHAVPALYMLIDLCVTKQPLLIKQSLLFATSTGLLYIIWTVVHYLLELTNHFGCRCIYTLLDWASPSTAIIWGLGASFVLAPVMILVAWVISASILHGCVCCNKTQTLPNDTDVVPKLEP